MSDVMLTVIYFGGRFLVSLSEAAEEQPLVDTLFPHIQGKRHGFQVRAYDHPVFTKLSLWEAIDATPSEADGDDDDVLVAMEEAAAVTECSDFSGDGYMQVYCVMKPDRADMDIFTRKALFRFGAWCYSGEVDLGVPSLHLGDVPNLLPALQQQQGSLSFDCEITAVPTSNPFHSVLRQYMQTLSFLQVRIACRFCDVFVLSRSGRPRS